MLYLCIGRRLRISFKLSSSPLYRKRTMATIRSSVPHEDRTAAEPRENRLEPVILSHIREINATVRLLRLSAVDPNHTIKVR